MSSARLLSTALVAACLSACGTSVDLDEPTPTDAVATQPSDGVTVRLLGDDGTLGEPVTVPRVELSEDEWRARLTDEEFYVTREDGTERAGTGDLLDEKRPGVFTCVGCGLPLFASETKFESGTGWPSFWDPIASENVGTEVDRSLFMVREEVHCARCEAHLGHVFDDGPAPTGLRYCLNSAALDFTPRDGG